MTRLSNATPSRPSDQLVAEAYLPAIRTQQCCGVETCGLTPFQETGARCSGLLKDLKI